MATFSQQFGQLGQQANPAITDATQNKNPGGFPNARAKPMPTAPYISTGPQVRPQPGGMQLLPGGGAGPRTGPMIDPRFGGPGGFYGRPRGPVGGGNIPGVGGVGGVQPGAFGRIEKGAWNDPNMRRGMGSPFGVQLPNNLPGYAAQGGGGTFPGGWGGGAPDAFRAMPQGPRFPGDPNGPRSGGPMAPPQQPGGPTANRPQPPMTPPNNGGGPANAAGQAAK